MDHGEDRRQVALPRSHEEQPVDGGGGNQHWSHHLDMAGRHQELRRMRASYTGRGMAFALWLVSGHRPGHLGNGKEAKTLSVPDIPYM